MALSHSILASTTLINGWLWFDTIIISSLEALERSSSIIDCSLSFKASSRWFLPTSSNHSAQQLKLQGSHLRIFCSGSISWEMPTDCSPQSQKIESLGRKKLLKSLLYKMCSCTSILSLTSSMSVRFMHA